MGDVVYVLSKGDIEGGYVIGVFRDRHVALMVARKRAHREWIWSRHSGRPSYRRKEPTRYALRPAYAGAELIGYCVVSDGSDEFWHDWWLVKEWKVR